MLLRRHKKKAIKVNEEINKEVKESKQVEETKDEKPKSTKNKK